MQSRLYLLFALFFSAISSHAQLIWTEPAFPTADDAVILYFDATQGNGGLADCNCDIYLHTGVITDQSNGPSDWQNVQTTWGVANPDWQMTPVPGQPNVYSYEITPSVADFYNVSGGEIIEQIAMVFRNANGTQEGKDVGNADIFAPIYEANIPFSGTLLSPSANSLLVSNGDQIQISAAFSQPADVVIWDDSDLLAEFEDATIIDYTLDVASFGTRTVEVLGVEAGSMNPGTASLTFTYTVIGNNTIEALPADVEPGINYIDDNTVVLALVAPNKNNVFVLGDFNDFQIDADYQMKNTPDGEIWWLQLDDQVPGELVRFQYLVDGNILTNDPYTELILDPSHDGEISDDTYPDMPAYPTGLTTGIVGTFMTGAPEYDWQTNDWERPDQTKLTIYELLMRDFIDTKNYQTLLDTLDYFERLGVNAIQFMPINEFHANNSWGYNPTFHGALDKYYGTKDAFKAVVDACHARGIAVILDIVPNHAHESNPLAQLYWDQANFRPSPDNIWMNTEPTHDFNVFFDFNHESDYTVAYFDRMLRYWLEEYRIDGYRFDLTKGLTQNENGTFDAFAYDASRIAILKHYADVVWDTSEDAYVIFEHFADNDEEKELSGYGCMFWGGFGPHRAYIDAAMGYNNSLTNANYLARGWADPHLVVYIESHDEERMAYELENFGAAEGDYDTKDFVTAMERSELSNVFFYMMPGPKMLWQFGEMGYDYSINYCENGTVNPNCRLSPKPIRWDYLDVPERAKLFNVIRGLNYLRNNHDVFHTQVFQAKVSNPDWKTITLYGSDIRANVIGNFDLSERTDDPQFPEAGTWYEFFTGEVLEVTDDMEMTLAPGEYRIYTDQFIDRPEFLTVSTSEIADVVADFRHYPNPANDNFQIDFALKNAGTVMVNIVDIAGRRIQNVLEEDLNSGSYSFPIEVNLSAGVYFLELSIDGRSTARKLTIVE